MYMYTCVYHETCQPFVLTGVHNRDRQDAQIAAALTVSKLP